jgi:hypothetical protein
MTSHEMRNPLSAVVQCADSASESLKLVMNLQNPLSPCEVEKELRASLDALQTITSCSLQYAFTFPSSREKLIRIPTQPETHRR